MRLALAGIVFCATLVAGLGQIAPGSPVRESSGAASIASVPLDCTSADDDGEWRPRYDPTASITESAWKWRTLHATGGATVRPEAIVLNALPDPPPAPATGAPSYLLHTPLLI